MIITELGCGCLCQLYDLSFRRMIQQWVQTTQSYGKYAARPAEIRQRRNVMLRVNMSEKSVSETDATVDLSSVRNRVAQLLTSLIQELVDSPSSVRIAHVSGERTTIFEVIVDREDVKRIIGRRGRTAEAIRELLFNLGAKSKQRFILEIVEPCIPNT